MLNFAWRWSAGKLISVWDESASYQASRRGNGLPRLRWVAGLRGRSATLGLKYGPDSYGRQQWGILRNGRKPDAATPREG